MATWRSGYAAVCKTVYAGSIPAVASTSRHHFPDNPNTSPPVPVDGHRPRDRLRIRVPFGVIPLHACSSACLLTDAERAENHYLF
jgi:hypothetical protein